MQLSAIDMNLLVAHDALLCEGSVTRAAARVGLSPSAMSHALGRLRELLDDPLFVRSRGKPTPRAWIDVWPLARESQLREELEPAAGSELRRPSRAQQTP